MLEFWTTKCTLSIVSAYIIIDEDSQSFSNFFLDNRNKSTTGPTPETETAFETTSLFENQTIRLFKRKTTKTKPTTITTTKAFTTTTEFTTISHESTTGTYPWSFRGEGIQGPTQTAFVGRWQGVPRGSPPGRQRNLKNG